MALTLDSDETIVYEVRRHWFVVTSQMIMPVIFALAPLFLYSFLSVFPITFIAQGSVTVLALFVYAIWLLIAWMWTMIIWTDYYLDLMILTNKRLIRVEQSGLFNREISYLDLRNIEDVKSEMHGIVATMLGYGDLSVQSAASNREFIINAIYEPFEVRDKLNQAIVIYERDHPLVFVADKEKPE